MNLAQPQKAIGFLRLCLFFRKNVQMKKIIALLISLSMLLAVVPFCVYANDLNEPVEYRDYRGDIVPFTRADGTVVRGQNGHVPHVEGDYVPEIDGVPDACYDEGLTMNIGNLFGNRDKPVNGRAYAIYDDNNLYFLVECYDDDFFNIMDHVTICTQCGKQRGRYSGCAHMAEGEYDAANMWDDDCVDLMIDWSNDGSVPSQYRVSRSGIASRDYDTWNIGFTGVGRDDGDVWYAEFAIPLNTSAVGTELGLHIMIHSQNSLNPYSETYAAICNYNATGSDSWGSDYYDYIILSSNEITCKHNAVTIPGVSATCSQKGLSYGQYCDKCGEVLKEQVELPANNVHDYVITVLREATCITEGIAEKVCCDCGNTEVYYLSKSDEHDYVVTTVREENCEQLGVYERICTVCDKHSVYIVPALGHDFSDGFACSVCGMINQELVYTVADGEATVIGYLGSANIVDVPAITEEGYPVTAIGEGAFSDCTTLRRVNLPESVKRIDDDAFSGCEFINTIMIPDGVSYIGSGAFEGCEALESIALPGELTYLGAGAFSGCTHLESIDLPGGLIYLGSEAFAYTAIESITVPGGIDDIGYNTFSHCGSLYSVTLEEGVGSIGYGAFNNCTSLAVVNLPESLESIGACAFGNCYDLESVNGMSGVSDIGYEAFANCGSLDGFLIPAGVTEIGSGTFSGCDSLTAITVPDGVTSIGDSAFYGCIKLTYVTVPDSVTSIGDNAFYNCTALTIYGCLGSYSEQYAESNSIPFQSICEIQGHDLTYYEAKAPTCTEIGWEAYEVCGLCPHTTYNELPVYHTVENGVCILCGESDPCKLGTHALVEHEGKAATCSEFGWSAYQTCSECDYTTFRAEPFTAHQMSGMSCSVCGLYGKVCESAHSYSNNADSSWTLSYPGAEKVIFSFNSSTKVENSYDHIYIYDGNGNQKGKYTGTSLASQSIEVAGDSVWIRLTSDGSVTEYGFRATVTPVYPAVSETDADWTCESEHNYANNADDSRTLEYAGAERVVLNFSEHTFVEDGYDFIYIYDEDGALIGQYTGDDLASATVEVGGDTAVIRLTSDGTSTAYGFGVAAEAVYPELPEEPETPTEPEPEEPEGSEPHDVIFGDVNGDGTVDATDATLLTRYANKWAESTYTDGGAISAAGDVNGDGTVDATDATLLTRYANKWAESTYADAVKLVAVAE